jgi:hypothetical protein
LFIDRDQDGVMSVAIRGLVDATEEGKWVKRYAEGGCSESFHDLSRTVFDLS